LHLRVDLVAIEEDGAWLPKLGAIPDMTAIPGRKLIVRYFDETGQPVADVIHGAAERMMPAKEAALVGFLDVPAAIPIQGAMLGKPLLEPLMRTGRAVGASTSAAKARADLLSALASLPSAYTRLRYPAKFPVGLTHSLAALKTELVMRHAC
jgi:nicotinate phosphoribosyltransferase